MPHLKPTSVVFLGTSSFAVPSLKALAKDKRFKIELVITQPDRPAGRKKALTPPPVKKEALALGLTIEQPKNVNSQFSILNSLPREAPSGAKWGQFPSPDFLVVVSYGQILSQQILEWPVIAPINVHASLLPKLRGASPIQQAILDGLPETGVTVQRMVKELDAGPVLSQRSVAIEPGETYSSLHNKLAATGADLLTATLSMALTERAQDSAQATVCRKLKKSDGEADPGTMSAEQIDRMVRALNPWPGVTCRGAKFLETSLDAVAGSLPLSCAGDSVLYVVKIQPAGGTPMGGQEYLLGHAAPSFRR